MAAISHVLHGGENKGLFSIKATCGMLSLFALAKGSWVSKDIVTIYLIIQIFSTILDFW